jgi:hypothetical protein
MTVKELIEQLDMLPQEVEVMLYPHGDPLPIHHVWAAVGPDNEVKKVLVC